MARRWGNNDSDSLILLFWAPKSLQMVTAAIKRCLLLGRSLSFYLPLSMGTIISTTLKGIPFCPGPQFSSVAQSCPTFCNPWTAALQASLSITNSWSLLRLNKPRQHIKKQRHYFANKIPSRLWFFQYSCVDVRVGLWIKLSTEELMLLNCGVAEDCWESLGLQGDPTSPS